MTAIIDIDDVTVTYPVEGSRTETFDAVSGVSLTIDAGDIFAIIGGSGAGKSTVVRLINALERPSAGRVRIDGADITTLNGKAIRSLRTEIGMVFQQFNLMNSRTVYGNIAFALESAGWAKERHRDRIAELLHFVGLAEKAWAYPRQLSGGQKQRVGIARALAANPKILLADEATSALDPQTTNDVLRLLKRVNEEFGITVVVITHEMDVVRKLANRVAVLDRGKLVEQGEVYQIFSDPQAELTKRIVENSLHDKPSEVDAALLSARYPGRLVSVSVTDDTAIGPVLAEASRTTDLSFDFVYGGISALAGKSVGSITLMLNGSDAAIESTIAQLREVSAVEDVR
ncbi:methionine ABC transporter ATP-binding protein [Gordonia sp. NPDC003425]